MRVTTDRISSTNALQKETGIPIGVIVKPYGDLSTVRIFLFDKMSIGRRNASS
jgi:hypothetical protein